MIRLGATTTTALILTLGSATPSYAQERMRTGMWENTVTSSRQTSTRSHCFKPADAAKSNGPAAAVRAETEKAMAATGGCSLKAFKLDDNTLTLTMACGSSTILQETKFHGGDTFETTMTSSDRGVSRVSQIKGHRTGDCQAGDR